MAKLLKAGRKELFGMKNLLHENLCMRWREKTSCIIIFQETGKEKEVNALLKKLGHFSKKVFILYKLLYFHHNMCCERVNLEFKPSSIKMFMCQNKNAEIHLKIFTTIRHPS